jgi:hypothetical protein
MKLPCPYANGIVVGEEDDVWSTTTEAARCCSPEERDAATGELRDALRARVKSSHSALVKQLSAMRGC